VLLTISSMDYLKYFLGEGTNPFATGTIRQFAGGKFLTTPIESEFNICSVTLAFMMGYYANFSLSAPNEKTEKTIMKSCCYGFLNVVIYPLIKWVLPIKYKPMMFIAKIIIILCVGTAILFKKFRFKKIDKKSV
ncbi:MAG TPA: hypothetical protein VKR58_13145, partial [Aquella sp.]|nr:hypothetical protein [Aquella sp.]